MLKGKGIISDLQKRLLLALHNLSDSPYFYLTGGTALAEFYFGHRKSYDLDIFYYQFITLLTITIRANSAIYIKLLTLSV